MTDLNPETILSLDKVRGKKSSGGIAPKDGLTEVIRQIESVGLEPGPQVRIRTHPTSIHWQRRPDLLKK